MERSVFVVLLAILTGCSTADPLPGRCVVEPLEIDFGSLIPPQSDRETRTVSKILTVSNLPPNTSPAGNELVEGTLEFRIQAFQQTPPVFYLVPVGTDPSFAIPNKGTVDVEMAVDVRHNTSTGTYSGTIDLGTDCTSIPFTFFVGSRGEPPPQFSLEWGGRGSGLGEFEYPIACAVDGTGNVYVVDRENQRIQKFDSSGNILKQWSEWEELDEDEGLTTFYLPVGIDVDQDGFVYVADREPEHRDDRVTKFDSNGNYVKRFGPKHGGGSEFTRVWHVAVDDNDNIFTLDRDRWEIKRIVLITTGVGYEVRAKWGTWGTGPGKFRGPYGLAVDRRNGHVYVTDAVNHYIQRFTGDGAFVHMWGTEGAGPGQFDTPLGVTVDDWGNVFVTDQKNRRVQKFDENGTFLSEWGIVGGQPGQFSDLVDVAVDHEGNVYLVDSGTHRIQKFTPPSVP